MGARRIGTRLVELGLISRSQLDDALRLQVVHGARVGTNLVEHFELDLDALTQALADQHGLPPAVRADFDAATPQIQESLPPELAARWLCVPLGITEVGGPPRILVASCDPLPEQATDELMIALGVSIQPAIAAELRIFYYLEQVYGFERPNRFKRVRKDESIELPVFFDDEDLGEEEDDFAGQATRERRRFVTTQGEEDAEGEPSREVLARIPIRRASNVVLAEHDPHRDLAELSEAIKAIKRAHGRDRVGDLVVEAMRRGFDDRFEAGMILVIREAVAIGWKGFVRGGIDGLVELVAIPMHQPSSVAAVVELATDYVGPPMQQSRVEARLWTVLEVLQPVQIAVVPVVLHGEIVCLLYGHTRSETGLTAEHGLQLRELAGAVSSAFERLTRAAQR